VPDFEEAPEAIARWLSDQAGRPIRFEKVEPGDEQILPPREQRELDGVLSLLALRDEGDQAGSRGRAVAALGPGVGTRPMGPFVTLDSDGRSASESLHSGHRVDRIPLRSVESSTAAYTVAHAIACA
jgi:hypothetical protein